MNNRAPREQALAEAIGTLGVWDAGLCFAPAAVARAAAVALEEAGYGAAWLHEGGHDPFAHANTLLAATTRFVVGTSIVSIWNHEPRQMANAARTLGEAFPGRFVLGIGTSHQGARSWHGRGYERPLTDLSEYLDAIDQAPYYGPRPDPPVPRMIAALGPKMLDLTRKRSRGAIPYLAPVNYTAFARERLGPDPVLAVHLAVVLGEGRERSLERSPSTSRPGSSGWLSPGTGLRSRSSSLRSFRKRAPTRPSASPSQPSRSASASRWLRTSASRCAALRPRSTSNWCEPARPRRQRSSWPASPGSRRGRMPRTASLSA